jgi:capsular polysaccharide biosynthesis protein
MELRDYYIIARRWWWLIVLPALVAGLYGAATYRPPATTYTAALRYTASQPASLAGSPGYDPNYYRWLTSEYIVTSLRSWVQTGSFAQAVSAELAARGKPVPVEALRGALGADNSRSILVVSFSSGDVLRDQVSAIFDAITTVLQRDNAAVFPQLGGLAAVVQPLDVPGVVPVAPSLRARLDLPLKLAVGLALGIGLGLLAHYLDPFVRDRRDLDRLGLPVAGEIPRARR